MLTALSVAVPAASAATPAAPSTQAHQPRTIVPKKTGPQLPLHIKPVNPPIVPAKSATPPKPAATTAPAAESAALAQAKSSGKPVEVTSETTSTTDVLANPNGTFTARSTLLPTRTQRNGSWVPIDTTLHRDPDGTFAPNATTQGLVFSGGGTTSMLTLTSGAESLSLAWPSALPTPRVSGATATYPAVLPGVDLELTATSTGYQEVLVVHDAAAAADPALAAIHLTATTVGLTLHADSDNLLNATDSSGHVVFQGETPTMWDSTNSTAAGPAPTATNPGTGHVTPLTVTASNPLSHNRTLTDGTTQQTSTATITVTPPASALTGPHVAYPLYVDPGIQAGSLNWVEVASNGAHYFNPAQWAQVGDCANWPGCNGLGTARSYFTMPTPELDNPNSTARIWSAQFFINEQWNAHDCTAEPVELDQAGPVDGNTRWPGPDKDQIGQVSSNEGQGCSSAKGGDIPPFDVTGYLQFGANLHYPTLTMALRAPDENNQYQWKQFQVGAGTPEMDATYSYPPNPASGLTATTAVTCGATSYLPAGQTTLTATATDNNNPPLPVGLWFGLFKNGQSVASSGAVQVGSGATGQWPVQTTLSPGNYQATVTVDNNPGDPAHDLFAVDGAGNRVTNNHNFTVLSPPTQAPVISTGQYPANYWGQPSNNPGGVGMTDAGATNIAGYIWTIVGQGTEPVPDTTQCAYNQSYAGPDGTATSGIIANAGGSAANNVAAFNLSAGLSEGYHVMYVRAFDYAHNLSPESQPYVFYVAAPLSAAANHWDEAEKAGTFGQPSGQNVALAPQDNCCGPEWSNGQQLLFEGNAQGQSFTMQINAPISANYELDTSLTKAADYGILSMKLDGTPVDLDGSPTFDGYSADVVSSFMGIGAVWLTQGTHTVTVTMTGTNSASVGNRYQAGVDGFWLQPTDQLENILPVSAATANNPIAVQATGGAGQGITPVVEPNDNGVAFPNGAQLLYPATAQQQSVDLSFNTPVEADYALGLQLTAKSNYGQVKITVTDPTGQQTVLGNTDATSVDLYSANEYNTYLPLGGIHLPKGQSKLTITVEGKNANSSGYQIGVENLTVAPVNNVSADSFADAMNNRGIATDNGPAGVDFDGFHQGMSATALAQSGVAPGSSFTTGGATFTIPPEGNYITGGANTTGPLYDNVVAYGQTIPLPQNQQIATSAVGLLVSATCGWSQEARAIVNYQTGPAQTPLFPRVPDWLGGEGDSATITVPYIDVGARTPTTAHQGHLYAVFLPADPTRKLKSITLPYTGADGLDNNCNGATQSTDTTTQLHVFAIAPRTSDYTTTPNNQSWLSAWTGPIDQAVPPPGGNRLDNQTVRMVVHPTSTGGNARIRLSNLDTPYPATISAVTIAAESGGTGTTPGTLAAPQPVTFGGKAAVTLASGAELASDPVAFPSTSGGSGNLVVSLYFGTCDPTKVSACPVKAPVHNTLANATFLGSGNDTANTDGTTFGSAMAGDFFLTGVDVTSAPGPVGNLNGTVAVLSDQTSVGGSAGGACGGGSAYQCTWVDDLATTPNSGVPGTIVNASRLGQPAKDEWKLNDGTGPTAADSRGGQQATASGGVTWNTGPAGNNGQTGSVTFDGTSGGLATSGGVIDTRDSFTVSAWVNPSQLNGNAQTFVAQQGTDSSGFALEYQPTSSTGGVWSFSRTETDGMNPTVVDRAESTTPAQANTWTLLTGTFDIGSAVMNLYVDGAFAAQSADPNPISSPGPLVIGHGFDGAANNFVTGDIADVQVYQRALSATDVHDLWETPGSQQPAAGAGAPSDFNTAITDGTNNHILPTSPAT
ncbi:MAG TPA: LamG domain-containing protein, partial [Pseudonocardiaceae bacterium]|nr:LamG domain-containing protein [Pseudonocardiaceae bacterium]